MADKQKIVAQIELEVSGAEQALQRLKNISKDGLLGKKGAKETDSELQSLSQKLAQIKTKLPGINAGEKEFKSFSGAIQKTTAEIQKCLGKMSDFDITDDYIKKNVSEIQQYVQNLKQADAQLRSLQSGVKKQKLSTYTTEGEKRKSQAAEGQMRELAQQVGADNVNKIKEIYKNRKSELKQKQTGLDSESETYKKIAADMKTLEAAQKSYIAQATQISQAMEKQETAANELSIALEKPKQEMQETQQAIQQEISQVIGGLQKAEQSTFEMSQSFEQVRQSGRAFGELGDQLMYLFSATSIFYAIRRVVGDVIEDFKELDKQFNEIAIVSSKSTSEMWDEFSSVNEIAQKFGVTTTNVLEVQNLYYHQGKETAEVNKLTAQTLTLAKITGMDYARATSDLTAALNAYNLSAEEAVRVTDTIAAMDTNAAISSEELMTALTKTASIAANAGMSLESTEIFLTKMIETTREAPENLGTALKTIIARFGEVKEEIDGEAIELADINRVDTALKTIGITLLDTTGQIRDLDDVFLELSAKWDDLDRNTQRYIATIAAGSRQQSRFIAMMEDYDRTLELTDAMNNSAGIGARQLSKSMESVETSLNTLKSSWQEFTQKFLKNKMLTGFLNTVNKLLDVINELPPVVILIGAAFAAWALKTKVLDKAMIAHKVIQDSVMKGDPKEITAIKLKTALRRKEESSLIRLTNIMKVYNTEEKTALALAANKISAKTAEVASIKTLTAEQYKAIIATGLYGGAQDSVNKEAFEAAFAFLGAEEGIEELSKEYGKGVVALAAYNLQLEQLNGNLKETTLQEYLSSNAAGQSNKKRGAGGLIGGIESLGKSLAGKGKSGGILSKIGGFLSGHAALLGKILIVVGIIAAVVAVIYGTWKLFFEASKDDTKKVEALAKAQENYNNALQKYKGLRDKVNRLEKIQSSQYKTTEQREEEQSIIQELVEEYPTLLDYIDAEGNYHIKNAAAIQTEIDKQKELMAQSQATYNATHATQAMQGIYADESTAAGKNISQLQDYYASFDENTLKELAYSIDSFGLGFSQTEFKKLAEAYASGEKFSFSYKDFNNMFAGFTMNQESFKKLSEIYSKNLEKNMSQDMAIRSALKQSGAYDGLPGSGETIDKITKAWIKLNSKTGNIYSDLLKNVNLELGDIYLKEGKVFVENELQDSGVNEKVKLEIAEEYANFKEEEIATIKDERVQSYVDAAQNTKEQKQDIEWYQNFVPGVAYNIDEENKKKDELAQGQMFWATIEKIKNALGMNDEEAERLATKKAEEKYGRLLELAKTEDGAIAINTAYEKLENITFGIAPVWELDETYKDFGKFLNNLRAKRDKEINNFKIELSSEDQEFFDANNFTYGEYDVIISYYDKLGEDAGKAFASGLSQIKTLEDEALTQDYLSLNFSSLSEISIYLDKVREKIGGTSLGFKQIEQDMIDMAMASGAIHFGDVISEAEELTERFDSLSDALEGFIGLASGEGDFTALSNYLNSLINTIDDAEEFASKMDEITKMGALTLDGIQIGGANTSAWDLVKQQQSQILLEMELAQGEYNKAVAQNNVAEQKRLLSVITLYRYAWGEAEAEYHRKQREQLEEDLEKQVEKLNQARDALKDYVSWLREFDRYANLDRSITQLEREQGHLEFEIDFLTNTKGIKNSMQDTVENLNTQIAANQGGIAAAKEEQNMWKDVIRKRNSDYVSFGPNGEAIVDTAKLQKLQEKLSTTTDESAREILQAEYDEIMNNVSAYNKAQDKVEDYTKALERNFKELETFLNGTYENVKKVEDKLIEVRMAAEDKELEAVKDKYEAIKEENEKYLDSVRDMINKERKIRDRANQEQDVKDKEKKLAMMKMDTSGIYAKDIQALERELNDDYQSLEDDAVDRAVEEMEEKYEYQAELYDKDIQFMENSLQYKREKMTEYNNWATQLLQQGSDAVLAYLKANDEEYYTGTTAAQALWESEWNGAVTRATASNELLQTSLLNTVKAALENCKTEAGNFEDAVITYSSTAQAEHGKIQGSVQTLTSHFQSLAGGVDGVVGAIGRLEDAYREAANEAQRLADLQGGEIVATPYTDPLEGKGESGKGEVVKVERKQGNFNVYSFSSSGETYSTGRGWTDSGKYDQTLEEIAYNENDGGFYAKLDGRWVILDKDNVEGKVYGVLTPETASNLINADQTVLDLYFAQKYRVKERATKFTGVQQFDSVTRYATGGFADFTGPAWLDGTKKRPEAVLNALQTKHFIRFTNVLDTLFGGHLNLMTPTQSIQKGGDANYTFHINVDQMASDYDVDRLIKRIEEKATKASQYRNVTILKKSN